MDVCDAFKKGLAREGYTVVPYLPQDMLGWLNSTTDDELCSVEAVLIGACDEREAIARRIRSVTSVPVLALTELSNLDQTLRLFTAGVDDVVRIPVHAREILARINAIRRRDGGAKEALWNIDGLMIYGGGRDIEIFGQVISVPRRELRILEYLAMSRKRRVTRAQIFNAIYGMLDEEVEECVVESHISKLRKKLKAFLGYDPIDTQRFLGYQLKGRVSADIAA
jgi:DNA-binding response OmpR family regulator